MRKVALDAVGDAGVGGVAKEVPAEEVPRLDPLPLERPDFTARAILDFIGSVGMKRTT